MTPSLARHPCVRLALPVLLLLAACTCGEGPSGGGEPGEGPGPVARPEPGAPDGGAGMSALPALSAAELDPVIRELGPTGGLPERIVVEFARALSANEGEREAGEGTVLGLEPSVAGSLTFTGPSTLVFQPSQAFAPSTSYKVTLESVETAGGVLKAPATGAWSREFRTPDFRFLRAELVSVEPPNASRKTAIATVDLAFSGPVGLGRIDTFASWTVFGKAPQQVRWVPSPQPHVARAVITYFPPETGRFPIEVALKAGIGQPGGTVTTATPAQGKVEIWGVGEAMQILALHRQEGPSGHFVEVVCDDGAVEEKHYRWFHELQEEYNISRRCMPRDEDAVEKIHLNPAVKFSIAPSASGFRILGDFKRGPMQVRIDAGLRTVDGGVLGSTFDRSISIPARKPMLQFVSDGRYLPRKAWRSLPVKHVNAKQAHLSVRHVPPQNLVFWMSDESTETTSERTADVVLDQKLSLPGAADVQSTTWVDVSKLLPASTKGLLEISVFSGSARDTARLLLTDMNLVAKRGGVTAERPWGEELRVWALDADSTEALSGVRIEAKKKSGMTVATCITDGERGCALALPAPGVDKAAPFALLATKGDDLTYLRFSDLQVDLGDAAVRGEAFRTERVYRAAVWTDRGVYRPGDVAHVAAVLRDRTDRAPKAGMPVEVTVTDPRDRTWKKLNLPTNDAGLVSLDLPFASFAATGKYQLRFATGGKNVGAHDFQVEEFVPERMKVDVAAEKPGGLAMEPVQVSVAARYLFGGIPKDHPAELTCSLVEGEFKPAQNGNYHYGVWHPDGKARKPFSMGTAEGTLDDEGKATLTCPAPEEVAQLAGPSTVLAKAAVFESGSGRTTQNEVGIPVHPERFYVGLQTGVKRAQAGKPLPVSGIVVDWSGNPVTDVKEVEVELVRLEDEYGWYYDEMEGDGNYQRYQRPVGEAKVVANVVGGKFTATFTPGQDASAFVVHARAGKARTGLPVEGSGRGYAWMPSESRVDQTPRPVKPGTLALELPPKALVGKPVEVKFNAPYRGRVLLTAETDKVLKSEWKKVDAGAGAWSFQLEAFSPNVYVSAFLVKDPHLDSAEAYLPDRAFGVRSVKVEPTEYVTQVKVGAPKEVRSNSKLTVDLDVGAIEGATFATVAAVDEGILQLTKFQTPDPLSELFAKRALGVQTFETIGWTLLVPPSGASRSTGGGDDGGDAGRVQPVKPVALWSGVIPVAANGKAQVTFDVPTYRGQLRVMAVVAGPKRIGSAQATVLVRDPLTLQVTLPRFLSDGDQIQIPVFLTNLSGAHRDVAVSLGAESLPVPGMAPVVEEGAPVEILGAHEKRLALKEGDSGVVVFQARARRAVGAAKFRVLAKAGDLESHDEADVPFIPAAPMSRSVVRVELTEGKTDLKPLLKGWLPTTERSTFWVTANPYGESFDHLKYLVHYPYG